MFGRWSLPNVSVRLNEEFVCCAAWKFDFSGGLIVTDEISSILLLGLEEFLEYFWPKTIKQNKIRNSKK